MGGPHARDHANVVLVDAHQRLEQGNASPRICLPQAGGKVPARGARGRQPPGMRQLKCGAERPGDIGLLARVANHSAAAPGDLSRLVVHFLQRA